MIHSLSDIQYAFYINLEHRKDRKEHVEKQLASVNITAERFNAIRLPNGAIGCSMSHLRCLEQAKKNEWSHLLICEDDIEFLNPSLFTQQMNTFFEKHQNDWDVVLLAGNNVPPYRVPENDTSCIQVTHSQTTTGYLIKSHYFDTLISNIKKGIEKLIAEPENHGKFAIDKYWLTLQKCDRWFLIVPLTVVQKTDYSDIEKKMTNYKNVMCDLDKKYMFEKPISIKSTKSQLSKINYL